MSVPHSWEAWSAVARRTGIGAGTTVLDVGCGAGGFCELAAARGAAVHGVDAMPDQIELARRRVPAGEFQLGLMEELPWPDRSFDVVTGFNAFQYALDVDLALSEARRVARPEARIAICKWARPQDNELFALLTEFGSGDGRLPESDPIDDAVRRAKLEILVAGDVQAPLEIPDEAALEAALMPAARDVDRRRVLDIASPFRRPDGSYRFENRLRYLIVKAI
jgi:SAM-dependent methyltransferase